MLLNNVLLLVLSTALGVPNMRLGTRAAPQQPLRQAYDLGGGSEHTEFLHPIKKVAVIGAGPAGLQYAAILIEHGFEVRLFERGPNPGGIWQYTDSKPIPASFPDRPINIAAYTPDIPEQLPHVHVFEDGESGVSNDWRWREQWNPSPAYRNLRSNSAPFFSELPDITYPPDTEWVMPLQTIQRHVRQYASSKGLNTNDEESQNITSYSTRVERLQKTSNGRYWNLVLRKYEKLPYTNNQLRAEWWSEQFDAVVVATYTFDSTHVPRIENLDGWARAFPSQVYHSRDYRRPERLRGKSVLVVGGSISASEIARDLSPHVQSLCMSVRHQDVPAFDRRRAIRRTPANVTLIPEIKSFSNIEENSSRLKGIRGASLKLTNGSVISDFDEIIFATGYRRSNPFLAGFHNSSIVGFDEPEVEVAPIITDGTHLRSLHWTGHYINDPTLAFTGTQPWSTARYQGLAFAKIWSGKAKLPSKERMWEEYPGAKQDPFIALYGTASSEYRLRLWVAWLNNWSLQFGGKLVSPSPIKDREPFVYFAEKAWVPGFATSANYTEWENTPYSEWRAQPLEEPVSSQGFEDW